MYNERWSAAAAGRIYLKRKPQETRQKAWRGAANLYDAKAHHPAAPSPAAPKTILQLVFCPKQNTSATAILFLPPLSYGNSI